MVRRSRHRLWIFCAAFLALAALFSEIRPPGPNPGIRRGRSAEASREATIPIALPPPKAAEDESYDGLPLECSFPGEAVAAASSPRPGRRVSDQTVLLVLEVSPRSIRLRNRAVKEMPQYEARRTDWTARYVVLDADGKILHRGGFDLPVLCDGGRQDCSVDHEKGDVLIPHSTELLVKIPHFEPATELRFRRLDRDGSPIDLGAVRLK